MTREPEWDDEQRDWALALKASEENRCPVCGGPINECTDPTAEHKWLGTGPVRCHRATAVEAHQSSFFEKAKALGGTRYPTALLWGVERNQ